ncbi:MAG: DsbA family protein [Halodesulfurarchaeum sp.]
MASLAGVGSIAGCLGDTSDTLPAPRKGDPDAPVTIESFEDFTCGHCKQFALEVVPDLESRYVEPGTAQYIRHDFPFLDPEWSFKTANAARAVQDTEGDEAFFEFERLLYENFGSYSLELFESLTESISANPETVRSAAVEGTYRPTLEAELELGTKMGVSATPTVFVNGVKAPSPRLRDVVRTVEDQL